MKLKKLILALALLTSCSSSFSTLYNNPLDAFLGRHKPKLEDKINTLIQDSTEFFNEKEEMRKYIYETYDVIEEGRGAKLACKLLEQLKGEYVKNTLLIVDIGTNHIYAVGKRLRNNYNVYFFSEAPIIEDFKEFVDPTSLYSSLLAFYGKEIYTTKPNKNKANAIIYGDDHSTGVDVISYFLTFDQLRKEGITKIIYAKEALEPKRNLKISEIENIEKFSDNSKLYDYLKTVEANGIEVECMGIEYDSDVAVQVP